MRGLVARERFASALGMHLHDHLCREGPGDEATCTVYLPATMTSFSLHFCTWQIQTQSLCRDHFAFLHKLIWWRKWRGIHTGIWAERAIWLNDSTHMYLVLPILPCGSDSDLVLISVTSHIVALYFTILVVLGFSAIQWLKGRRLHFGHCHHKYQQWPFSDWTALYECVY